MHAQLRAYAVGAKFSADDVADEFAWRRRSFADPTYDYRRARPRPQPTSDNRPRRARRAPSPVVTRIDPSRVRTPEQQRAVARALA